MHFVLVRRNKRQNARQIGGTRSEDGIKVLNIYHLTPPSLSCPERRHMSCGSEVYFINDAQEFGKKRENCYSFYVHCPQCYLSNTDDPIFLWQNRSHSLFVLHTH